MNRTNLFNIGMVAFLLSLLFSATNLAQTDAVDVATKIDEFINNEVAEGRFSGSVLVADEGEILLSKGYGMANIEHGVMNTPETKFRIASITKQFTAMAIMILQERGLLNVQDPICLYVPDCPVSWEPVTIHHLLTHTSGIFNCSDLPDDLDYIQVPHTLDEMITRFKDKPLNFTPGDGWGYSNSGYILLGLIIELVSGQTYEDFLSENIFVPLGMINSGVDHPRVIVPNRADGYTREEGILVNAIYYDVGMYPAHGALYSTLEDLYLWDEALYTTQIVSQETMDIVFTPHSATGRSGCEYAYGYGWFIGEQFDRQVVGHSGGMPGFSTYIHRFPQEDICIIILSNFEFVFVKSLKDELAALIESRFNPMLIAHWALDETEGHIAHDSVSQNHAELFGDPVWRPTEGVVGGALQLDGDDDFVGTEYVLDPSEGPFSVFVWINGGTPGQTVVSQLWGVNWLRTDNLSGYLLTELREPSHTAQSLISEVIVTDGNWHHVGLTWDGTNRVLYVDNVKVAADTQSSLARSVEGLNISCGPDMMPGSFFSGMIDDIRIYNRAVNP